jgi:hypothetical protein
MENEESRVQKKTNGFSCESRAAIVVRALNSDLGGKMKGNRKIVDSRALLVLVKRLQALDTVLADSTIPLFSLGREGKMTDSPEVLRKLAAVNRFLWRYTATPVILPDYMGDANPLSRGWRQEWIRAGKREQPFIEIGFVLDIVGIASAGRISSLKQCEYCRRWLFARFPHQRFCSDSCKELFHRSNEADKKRRREWAKHNYWLHKNRNIK